MSNVGEQMKADALEAQRFSRKYLVVELDFSESSIGDLEAATDTVQFALPGGKSDENVELLTRIWGAHLGEVLRRVVGGEWVEEQGRPVLKGPHSAAYPHEQVRQRLVEGGAHNLVDYFQQIKKQL